MSEKKWKATRAAIRLVNEHNIWPLRTRKRQRTDDEYGYLYAHSPSTKVLAKRRNRNASDTEHDQGNQRIDWDPRT